MANATPSRLGVQNATTDGSFAQDNALFLKVFAGLVLKSYHEENVMAPLHRVKTITSGKTAQFPALGTTSADYHTPGTELTGSEIKHNERTINLDPMLIADVFVADIDQLMNHYETKAEYASVLGRSLALTEDRQLLQLAVLAARASATISGGNGGTVLTNANYGTDADTLAAGIFDVAKAMDEKNVPARDRYVVVSPSLYYKLVQNTNAINRDWGGSGSYSDGKIIKIADITIVKSNNLPTGVVSAGDENNTYSGTFTNTVAVAFQREALGTVKLLDLTLEMGRDIRRQGDLMLAKMAVGHGILRPECAVELKTA